MHPFLDDVKRLFYDSLFPIHCTACGSEGVFLCTACIGSAEKLKQQRCVICGRPSLLGFTHPRCGASQMPDAVISLFDYHDRKVADAIIYGKYYMVKKLYHLLGSNLAGYLKNELTPEFLSDFILVPVPLAKRRQRWRGFNQAEVIVYELTKELGMPVQNILVRKRNTKTQKDLNKEQRKRNVLGSFALKAGFKPAGRNYLLVDDVVTTGATLIEAVKVLKRNGANKVWCVTVARD